MKKFGKELSGRRLQRFFTRFFEAQPDINHASAERMARDLGLALTALRLRQHGLASTVRSRQNGGSSASSAECDADKLQVVTETAAPSLQAAIPANTEVKFNPYAFGLVPVFVREGPDGLMQRLNKIHCLDHLRKIARAQQIALPAEFRNGEVAVDDVRFAIVAAVRKRIADRRAAAG
ncbi:MAG: hypothetical protein AAFW82_10840 [Pseudomonadota bacterium]